MNSNSIVQTKSFNFSIQIIKTYQYLVESKREFTLSKQLLRSGTSIGANVTEAEHGQSTKDSFINYPFQEKRQMKRFIGCDFWALLVTWRKLILKNLLKIVTN